MHEKMYGYNERGGTNYFRQGDCTPTKTLRQLRPSGTKPGGSMELASLLYSSSVSVFSSSCFQLFLSFFFFYLFPILFSFLFFSFSFYFSLATSFKLYMWFTMSCFPSHSSNVRTLYHHQGDWKITGRRLLSGTSSISYGRSSGVLRTVPCAASRKCLTSLHAPFPSISSCCIAGPLCEVAICFIPLIVNAVDAIKQKKLMFFAKSAKYSRVWGKEAFHRRFVQHPKKQAKYNIKKQGQQYGWCRLYSPAFWCPISKYN